MSDLTVHAGIPDGGSIVRYDRTGKYYLEYPPAAGIKRKQLTLHEAAALAVNHLGEVGAFIALGRPGGLRFDAEVRKLR